MILKKKKLKYIDNLKWNILSKIFILIYILRHYYFPILESNIYESTVSEEKWIYKLYKHKAKSIKNRG